MMLTITPSLLAELDAFRDRQLDKPSRQEAIRQLMVQALSASKKKR
jgi:metal-responsive CopG/Arc/MetJ family transcriptional regulator